MSSREFAKNLIDQIPDSRLYYVISYLQGAAVPDETAKDERNAAFLDKLERGLAQVRAGQGIVKTMDELEAMEEDGV